MTVHFHHGSPRHLPRTRRTDVPGARRVHCRRRWPILPVRDERGSASLWALILTAGAFTVLLGLVVDGGHLINDRTNTAHIAAQAARAGADALSDASVRSGNAAIAAGPARQRALAYLHRAGMHGTVTVHRNTVTVTITARTKTDLLGIIGITSLPVHETETASAITEDDTP